MLKVRPTDWQTDLSEETIISTRELLNEYLVSSLEILGSSLLVDLEETYQTVENQKSEQVFLQKAVSINDGKFWFVE